MRRRKHACACARARSHALHLHYAGTLHAVCGRSMLQARRTASALPLAQCFAACDAKKVPIFHLCIIGREIHLITTIKLVKSSPCYCKKVKKLTNSSLCVSSLFFLFHHEKAY